MPHLTPDTIARFFARTLDARERRQAFEHLADCADCREWIAVHAQLTGRKPRPSVWQAAAAGIAVAFFAWWLTSARPAGEPEPLPAAWRQIRLMPAVRPANQVSLTTTFGEKWIALDGAFESIVP